MNVGRETGRNRNRRESRGSRPKVFPTNNLEAFAVDNARAGFVVFLLGDPHLLEGSERGEDGAAYP